MKCSVIVPMYNSKETIGRCINSLLLQTYQDYEIIVIDDGSTDESVTIVKAFNSENISILHQPNQGVSAARNLGLDNARGDLIFFIDSDDYVNSRLLEKVVNSFRDNKCDAVFFGFTRVENHSETEFLPPHIQDGYYNNLVNLSRCDTFGYPWIKAIKRECIASNRFRKDVKLYEDELFSLEVFKTPRKICSLRESLYNYVINHNSLSFITHQDYCSLCDNIYKSWKNVIGTKDADFLNDKANHLYLICKYYGLEKDINVISYFKDMKNKEFFIDCTTRDDFYYKIREKNLAFIVCKAKLIKIRTKVHYFLRR